MDNLWILEKLWIFQETFIKNSGKLLQRWSCNNPYVLPTDKYRLQWRLLTVTLSHKTDDPSGTVFFHLSLSQTEFYKTIYAWTSSCHKNSSSLHDAYEITKSFRSVFKIKKPRYGLEGETWGFPGEYGRKTMKRFPYCWKNPLPLPTSRTLFQKLDDGKIQIPGIFFSFHVAFPF